MGALREEGTHQASTMFMPDMSDVGAPAKGPGLPQRIPEAPPPPVRVKIEHGKNVEVAIKLYDELLRRVPGAILERTEGLDDSLEIEINGKLIYSRSNLGKDPDIEEIVEITKWGHRGKSFLHMYLCSVAEGGEPRMVITDRKNTPVAKRIVMSCSIQ